MNINEPSKSAVKPRKIRINLTLEGELAEFLIQSKIRGQISSYCDAVLRGLSLLQRDDLEKRALELKVQRERA